MEIEERIKSLTVELGIAEVHIIALQDTIQKCLDRIRSRKALKDAERKTFQKILEKKGLLQISLFLISKKGKKN